ncbi:MAG: hypothetical protein HY897_01340, partial [Deltaproteobacteria bacterium]|nr:hypothetical protein [Deltaproteobacteria bacterium]
LITVTFDSTEAVTADVRVGANATSPCTATGSAPAIRYTCEYTVVGAPQDQEGQNVVSVVARDQFGNQDMESGGAILDFSPPFIMGSAGVTLTRPAGCPLASDTLGKLTFGSAATVTFTVSEALLGAEPVEVKAKSGAQEFVLSKTGSSGLSYTYSTTIPGSGSFPQGAYTLEVKLRDATGNEQTVSPALESPGLSLDTAVPAQPDVNTTGKIVYKRVPWGSDATAGIKAFQIAGGADSVTGDATWVLAYDGPDPAAAAEIGRKAAVGGNFGTMDLNRADRTEIHLAASDTACNRSQPVKVKDVEWVATMGYKVPGSGVENPGDYSFVGRMTRAMAQDAGFARNPSAAELPGLGLVGGGVLTNAGVQYWLERPNEDINPSGRSAAAMAFDAARGRAVLFGGLRGGANLQDTWEWDGHVGAWLQQPLIGSRPGNRSGHSMVYDHTTGKVFLFGGWDGSYKQDMWQWVGSAAAWTERTLTGTKPAERSGHSMVYDSARRSVVVFGGMDGWTHNFGDTWEWNPDTGEWIDRTPAGPSPTARNGAAMVFDASRGVALIFGGWTSTGVNQETWEWDGTAGTWTERTPVGAKPSARTGHTMSFDRDRNVTVLFGGWTSGGDSQETWEWDGAAGTWTPRAPLSSPPARDGHGMAYDVTRRVSITFGGYSGGELRDVWEFDGVSCVWRERTPTGIKPAARAAHAMAFAGSAGRAVMFGGGGDDQTWEWEGTGGTWIDRSAVVPRPSARGGHSMAYDSSRGKVVMFGGGNQLADIWEYTPGDAGSWADRSTGGTQPAGRTETAMAFDNSHNRIVLFGGFDGSANLQDTWEWNGATGEWTDRTQSGAKPPGRRRHAMTYDAARERMVLFGGNDGAGHLDDTWEWDETTGIWADRTPPPGERPSARELHALVHVAARKTSLLFGGRDAGGTVQGTWVWDGAAGRWSRVDPASAPPSARYGLAMTYDDARRRVVLFGGMDQVFSKQDVWEWDGGDSDSPGQIFSVPFSTAGVPSEGSLISAAGTFFSGGVGYPSGVATNGVNLLVWDEGMWKTVATNNSPPDNPQLVTWSATDPTVISRLFFGDQQTLNFAVTPVAPNGTGTGEVSTDYAEVTVRYRLP